MKKIFYSLMVAAIAAFTFTSCEDVPMPYDQPGTGGGGSSTTVDPVGTGTAADPYNIAALNAFAKTLEQGQSSEDIKYFRGKVVSFKSGEEPGNTYGNTTFYISDDGTSKNQFYVYRCKGPGNSKITDPNLVKEGDEVVVCGKITNYNGTLETEQNTAYIVSINGTGSSVTPGTTAEPAGAGTAADPYNVAKANEVAAALEKSSTSASYLSDEVYVKGKICSITDTELSSYGNITYYISDDGTTAGQLEVYRGLSIDGAKFKTINDIKVGDVVVVKGKLQNWLGTLEFTQGSSLVSINGAGNGGGNTDQPTGEAKGDGTETSPYNVAGILAYTRALAADVNSDKQVYFTGTVDSFKSGEEPGNSYGNATFYIKDDSSADKFYCFRVMGPGNQKFTSADQLKVGQKVVVCGNVVNYKGNTPETVTGKAYVVSIDGEGTSAGGNDNPGGNTGSSEGLSISGTTVTLTASGITAGTTTTSLDLSTLGYENAADVTTVTFPDGATLTFDKNTNKNAPKYYTATNGVRVYSDNILTFTGASNIAVITMECDAYNGVDYVGSKTATISFSGKTAVYTNVNDGANTQLRVKKITITYAK